MHILLFVFLCYQDIGSVWLEIPHFTHSKLLDLPKHGFSSKLISFEQGCKTQLKQNNKKNTNLSAKSQFIAQCGHVILQQVYQTLEEWVIFTLHVCVPGKQKMSM